MKTLLLFIEEADNDDSWLSCSIVQHNYRSLVQTNLPTSGQPSLANNSFESISPAISVGSIFGIMGPIRVD